MKPEEETKKEEEVEANYQHVLTPKSKSYQCTPFENESKKTKNVTDKEKEEALKEEIKKKAALVSIWKLFSFADKYDILLMLLGACGAVGTGIVQPLQTIFYGDILNALNAPGPNMQHAINEVVLKFVYTGIGVFVSGFLQTACWSIAASRQTKRLREHYVRAILDQEIGWYDLNDPLELATKTADLTALIQEGIGRKLAEGVQYFSMFAAGFIIGFIKGWELALVILAFSPLLAICMFFMMKALAASVADGSAAYAKAGGVAEETLGSIRTVHSFNAIEERSKKFDEALVATEEAGIKKGIAVGLGVSSLFLVAFCTYAVALYYGATKVVNDRNCHGDHCYTGGKVLMVFFSVMTGAMAFGQAGPSLEAVFSAKAAAYDIFMLIDRVSKISPFNKEGITKEKLKGTIHVKNVTFRYPSRTEVTVCENYNLQIAAGEKVALVGASGSGKSTLISLIERFYDPEQGEILIDGVNIKNYNIQFLRQQISLVGQEPVLFSMSILENIRYGKPTANDEEVYEAAKMANAYEFISAFPNQFQTEVGERGIQLSGGQKQRIAIARAIIKDPSILLLDEATSALDTESEKIVQESLDKLLSQKTRTTIIVAHRLSTIQDANKIAVHHNGHVVELGTHTELMKIEDGRYRALVESQRQGLTQTDQRQRVASSSSAVTSEDKTSVEPGTIQEMTVIPLKDDKPQTEETTTITTEKKGFLCWKKQRPVETATAVNKVPLSRIWGFSKPDNFYVVLGCLGAMIAGAIFPLWGFMITKMTVVFYTNGTRSHVLSTALKWAIGFVALGIANFIGSLLQNINFFLVSERITRRIRSLCFHRMLQQEIGWYDLDENNSGALTTRLATDSAIIQSMTSETLNRNVMTLFSLGTALIISFIYSWKMTLIVLAVFPIMGLGSYVQGQMMSGENSKKKANDSDTKAGALLSETVGSIRTICSFTLEEHITNQYKQLQGDSKETDKKKGVLGGFTFGLAFGLLFMSVAFLYWFGGYLITHNQVSFEGMFMVIMAMMLSSFGVGIAAQNMADAGKAQEAAFRIFSIIDREPLIQPLSTDGIIPTKVEGHLLFQNLDFYYPSRPSTQIYKKYVLEITAGQTVALVGHSGCGKSTAIALLERFYDPMAGMIYLDGKDLKSYNIRWLRENISLVSQEPVLFAGTIKENIRFGKFTASDDEIIAACKSANAHDFIMQFPNGYDTDVGERGVQISGGQKQRIAIARAILRDPKILLLDEATSALDNVSEEIVQKSLDQLLMMKKRTTIIVAHRLSTIRNADKIAVTQNGKIVEQGTHEELMKIANGVYVTLVSKQMAIFGTPTTTQQ